MNDMKSGSVSLSLLNPSTFHDRHLMSLPLISYGVIGSSWGSLYNPPPMNSLSTEIYASFCYNPFCNKNPFCNNLLQNGLGEHYYNSGRQLQPVL